MFLLVLSGCGYKADPFYIDNTKIEDKNVKFIINQEKVDNTIDAI